MLKQTACILGLILFVCVCRTLPHLANFSPMIIVALFATRLLSEKLACFALIASMLLSDVLLSAMHHYPIFGMWSLFTYSALLAVLFVGSKFAHLESRVTIGLVAVLASNLGFWAWTNFGTWLFSGMYHLSFSGLISCYALALPFLQHSTLSALAWFVVAIAGFRAADLCMYRVKTTTL